MNYKTAVSNANNKSKSEKNELEYIMISQSGKSAVTVVNNDMRWLDDGQIAQFGNPQFRKANAEFEINGKSYHKIWFSQLSSNGVCEDLQTPLLDEIIFKGQPALHIRELYKSAKTFWDAVKNKNFKVEIINTGFSLNLYNDLVSALINDAVAKRKALPGKADKVVFDYIRQEVERGNTSKVMGTLKKKVGYRLIEI